MVKLQTNFGVIALELDPERAPETVKNFLAYVESGFYSNTVFHRVIDGFMVQGGGFEPGMRQKPTRGTIKNEAGNGLKNDCYTIAMADLRPAFSLEPVFHQRQGQRLPESHGAQLPGMGLLRVRQGRPRPGHRRQNQARKDRQPRGTRRRSGRGRLHREGGGRVGEEWRSFSSPTSTSRAAGRGSIRSFSGFSASAPSRPRISTSSATCSSTGRATTTSGILSTRRSSRPLPNAPAAARASS